MEFVAAGQSGVVDFTTSFMTVCRVQHIFCAACLSNKVLLKLWLTKLSETPSVKAKITSTQETHEAILFVITQCTTAVLLCLEQLRGCTVCTQTDITRQRLYFQWRSVSVATCGGSAEEETGGLLDVSLQACMFGRPLLVISQKASASQ